MTGRSSQLDAVGCDVGALCSWERRVGPTSSRGGIQKRVSLGLHPVSLRKSKEMGWNGQQGAAAFAQGNGAHVQSANKVPPCLCLLRVRRYVGWGSMACPAFRPHFFGACPKKRCRAAKEKRFYYPGGSTIRVSATASVVFTHLRPTWGGGWWLPGRSSQLDAVGGDVGASSPWERRAGPNSCRGGTHKRVSLGLHPVSLRKSKEMGWNGQQGGGTSARGNGAPYWAQKSRRQKPPASPPLPWGPNYNLHVSGRWVASPVLPRFQLPTPRSRGEPGGLQFTQECGIPY